jgi:hypothetical protein
MYTHRPRGTGELGQACCHVIGVALLQPVNITTPKKPTRHQFYCLTHSTCT